MKSYGTEGRELLDTSGQTNFVPPQDTVHAFLLFRGQDIKDLHVHEQKAPAAAAPKEEAVPVVEPEKEEAKNEPKETSTKSKTESKENKPKKGGNQKNMVGSGASLLNKKARGAKGDHSEYLLDSISCFI